MKETTSPPACPPRFATPRDPSRRTLGTAIGAAAEAIGQPLMPWQQLVADVGGEIDDEGIPCYREVIFSTPRQSGKTILQLAWTIQRARGWADITGQPQKILYSAQTGQDARKKLLEDWTPILEARKPKLGIRQIARAAGGENILFRNGSRLILMGSGEDAGHGKTIDLALQDELFADTDMRRDQALVPAMATRPFGQMLTCSTMGTPASVAWNAKVAKGRNAVETGAREDIAYFEWSADPDADPEDPATWASCMPALGYTQHLRTIRSARTSITELAEWRRAFLNIPTMGEADIIPAPSWATVCSVLVECEPTVFALDANPDRTRAAIVAAGGRQIELVDARDGTGWVVPECVRLFSRYGKTFTVAKSGPAAAFVSDLVANGVKVVETSQMEETRAAQEFLDAVVNLTIEVKTDDDLDAAVRAAAKRPVGDAWCWGRKSALRDISPLVAASIALYQAEALKPVDIAASVW